MTTQISTTKTGKPIHKIEDLKAHVRYKNSKELPVAGGTTALNKMAKPALRLAAAGLLSLCLLASATSTLAATGGAQLGVMIDGPEHSWIGYPVPDDLNYLRNHGVSIIRCPIAWELMQPKLNGPLDPGFLAGLKNLLQTAVERDMQVLVELHNHGRYDADWIKDKAANGGIFTSSKPDNPGTHPIGSAGVPITSFADFWKRLSTELTGKAGLLGYDLMNEPFNMPDKTVWPSAAQAAVTAIRAVDMTSPIYVEGDEWTNASNWPAINGKLDITDPANKLVYSAHQYFDDGSGMYYKPFDPNGVGWDFTGRSGLQRNGSDWGGANAPEGVQTAFLKGKPDGGGVLGSISQSLTFPAGEYALSFQAAQTWDAPLPVQVSVDGIAVGTYTPSSKAFERVTTAKFTVNAGSHLIALEAADKTGDKSTFIDDVTVVGAPNRPTFINSGFETPATKTFIYGPTGDTPNRGVNLLLPFVQWLKQHGYQGDIGEFGVPVKDVRWQPMLKNFIDAMQANGISGFFCNYTYPSSMNRSSEAPSGRMSICPNVGQGAEMMEVIFQYSAPKITGDVITTTNAVTLTGTGASDNTVNVYDGGELIGTTKSDRISGKWSFTTGSLASGTHNLTATNIDSTGNSSQLSFARAVTAP